jgi:hypothetical protein
MSKKNNTQTSVTLYIADSKTKYQIVDKEQNVNKKIFVRFKNIFCFNFLSNLLKNLFLKKLSKNTQKNCHQQIDLNRDNPKKIH